MTGGKKNGLRITSTVLAAYWLACAIDLGGLFAWNYALYLLLVPWCIALIVIPFQAARKRDWYSLTLLASIWAANFGPIILRDQWWYRWESHTPNDAMPEWCRLTKRFANVWMILLALAFLSFVLYTVRLKLRNMSFREQVTTSMAAIIGALGFPTAPAAILAFKYEVWSGGGGIFSLFPIAVISLVLFGAALRGPQAVASRSLTWVLRVASLYVLAVVAMCSNGTLPRRMAVDSPWESPIWGLFAMNQLGAVFTCVALAWILLASLARRVDNGS